MHYDNTIEVHGVAAEARQPERNLFQDSFEAALRVNKHHAHKFDKRLRDIQQQARSSDSSGREGSN